MRATAPANERPLFWVGSSKRDLQAMPEPVMWKIGLALSVAQHGGMHPGAKAWKGDGPGVFEVVSDFDGNTFRGIYTVRFRDAIYVLHCFQKKSPTGRKTARKDADLVRRRMQVARADFEARYGKTNQ